MKVGEIRIFLKEEDHVTEVLAVNGRENNNAQKHSVECVGDEITNVPKNYLPALIIRMLWQTAV